MILVIGSKGLLGSKFYEVCKLNKSFVFWNRNNFDLLDKKIFKLKLKKLKPKILINCLAYSDVNNSEIYKSKCYHLNTDFPLFLAKICNELNIFMYHFSSDYVYGNNNKYSLSESDFCYPLNYYGNCKYLTDLTLFKFCPNACIFRTSWLFSISNENNFVYKILNKLTNKKKLEVVIDQFGSPTSTDFLVSVVLKSINQKKKFSSEVINVSLKGKTTWFHFANEIINNMGTKFNDRKIIPILSNELKNNAIRPKNSYLNCKKLKHFLPELKIPTWKKELKNLFLLKEIV